METIEKSIKMYKKRLRALSDTALPLVIANTVSAVARRAHEESIVNILNRYIIRNKYTVGSVKFFKANPKKDIMKINAITGSVSNYMDEQDLGGKKLPKSGSRVPMPTLAARGGSPQSVVKRKNRAGLLGNNQFVGIPKGNKKNRPYGVYERIKNNKFLSMIRNISNVSIEIEGTRWHRDATDRPELTKILQKEFLEQARLVIENGLQ